DLLEPELDKYRAEYAGLAQSEEDILSLALFPQVAPNFIKKRNLKTPPIPRAIEPLEHREQERNVAPISRG
ncbi:MAG: oxaloacetate decarboxylase subunit alpha, partial [Oscillospiraceae bacterium]|nr:oxaloacetate decarboxylase subunit alpha [Oscillospiraceae bacterium]